VSANETQDQGGTQGAGEPQPQQPAPQPAPEAPAPEAPAPSEDANWVAPDYGISWATRTAVPPSESEKHT
jgi:hypothetical protein